MKWHLPKSSLTLLMLPILAIGAFTRSVVAQNAELQQKIRDLKEAAAANKQALAEYTYVQTTTISLTGPDGKPQRLL